MGSTGMAAKKNGTIARTVRTRATLLSAMSDAGLENEPGIRWLAGVKFEPRDCSGLTIGESVWYCTGTDDTPPTNQCVPWLEQQAFNIFDGLRDSTLGRTVDDIEELLRLRHEEMLSYAFGYALTGQATFGGLTFPTQAHGPDGVGFAAAAPIGQVVAQLENDLAKTMHGAEGIIHMAPGMLIKAATGGTGIVEDSDGMYRTPLGTKVVADAGYYRAAAPTGQSASTANTTEWVYASGPIAYMATPQSFIGDAPNAFTNISKNALHRHTESWGLFLFDPCAVAAQLASYAA